MTPEAKYLIASLRTGDSPAATSVDWAALLDLSDSHGVLPLLCRSRQSALPQEFATHLREGQARSLLLASELEKLLEEFDRYEIEVLALKGPVLAELLYGQVSLRPSSDLDLLACPAEFPRAESLLLELGFTPVGDADDYHREFERDGTFVEMHFGTSSPSAPRFDLSGAWARCRFLQFRGHRIRFLSPVDLILYLALHGLKHRFARLIWVLDLARALAALDVNDASNLMDTAAAHDLGKILLVSCEIARQCLATELPTNIAAALATQPKLTAQAAEMADAILASNADPANFVHDPSFYLQFADDPGRRWKQRFRFFLPTHKDYKWVARHNISAKCAPLVRPFRLLRRHGPAPALRALFPRSGNKP